jgi:tetratricopeptide (TPR) repeat protein
MHRLASAYHATGRLDKALPLYQEALTLCKTKLGADHPVTLATMHDLAAGYQAAGQPGKALPLLEDTLQRRKARLGADHPDTLATANRLASAYVADRHPDRALPLLEETVTVQRARLGADHPDTLKSMHTLAATYQATGKRDLALPLYEQTLKLRRVRLGDGHPDTLVTMNNLASGHRAAGRRDLALPLLQEAAAGVERLRFQHLYAGRIVRNLITCCEELGQFDQAEAWRRKWMVEVRHWGGTNSLPHADELAAFGRTLLKHRKWADAESILRDELAVREKKDADGWATFYCQSQLGAALSGRKRHADAEPLLRAGYEGLKQRAATIPKEVRTLHLTEALERLVQLYEETNKPDEAAKWREALEAQKRADQKPGTQAKP